jgi:alpha-tubulin suppressor-like RCC1 family protein
MAAITENGTLYMWGESTYGCLGKPPSNLKKFAYISVPTEVEFFSDKKVYYVACGEAFTFVLTNKEDKETNSFRIS